MISKRAGIATVAAVMLAAALALSACGGDKDSESSPTAAPQSQATQAPGGGAGATATRPAAAATAAPTTPAGGVVATIAAGTGALAIEACRLVTRDEITAAVGEQVQDPQGFNVGTQTVAPGLTVSVSACSYQSSRGSVDITFWRAGGTVSPQIRQALEAFLCEQKERVQGIGDLACWYDSTRTELLVLKGTTFIDVQLEAANPQRTQEAIRTLVQRALSRLQ
ncbi:MAG TPA: hypothetical protein VNN10_01130 [Dehalococcoidia bacterium]|nr:hypothetical protein [Dehalococcoidia bacterium]